MAEQPPPPKPGPAPRNGPQPQIKDTLESDFLLGQAPDVRARLQACLTTDSRNIRPGKRDPKSVDGLAVIAIQDALTRLRASQPEIVEIKDAPADYGTTTRRAVTAYKSKHRIQRAGQALDDIVGRMTLTQIDDDLGDSKAKPKQQPALVRTQDILIEIGGFDRPEQQGLPRPKEEEQTAKVFNTPNYLIFHLPLVVIMFIGGENPNPVRKIIERLESLIDPAKQTAPVGRVFVHGGSAGGRNTMDVVRHLRNKGVDVTYVALWDAAFQPVDLVDRSQFSPASLQPERPATLRFKGLGVKMNDGVVLDNFFQSWGHTLSPEQEIHGAVDGFAQTDFTNDPEIVAIKVGLGNPSTSLGRTKQKALAAVHTIAFKKGRARAGDRISARLRQQPLQ